MRKGDIVKFREPLDANEALERFVLIEEPDGGRVLVQCICDPSVMLIAPTKVLVVSDLAVTT